MENQRVFHCMKDGLEKTVRSTVVTAAQVKPVFSHAIFNLLN